MSAQSVRVSEELAGLERAGAVARLTLRRPDRRNALSRELLAALHARVDELAGWCGGAGTGSGGGAAGGGGADGGVLACVVTGEGPAFCAGMDLRQAVGDAESGRQLLRSLAELTWKLRALGCVTVAAVHGAAIGGGCGLVTVCDAAVTHAQNTMGFPEVDMGVCPAVVAPWLVRRIGAGRARRVLLMGGLMRGREAYELGVVSECVETPEGVLPAAEAIASRVATGGPRALRATKGLMNELDGSGDLELLLRAAEVSARVLASPDTQARLRSKLV
ncbi:MAG: enoyl-CoA hydratase [Planctomyces sp.]|nr:enoyl-CoA hydratase [Planctomyces sp.]MBA4119265.1 enoyl-CoA hydratase [Isosphaera sp.]